MLSTSRFHRRALAAPIAVVAVAGLLAAGCARKSSDPQTTSLQLEPVGYAGANPFTPPAGTDRPGVTPPAKTGGTVAGNTAGLYGGTQNVSTCNPQAMVTFLQQHPDKATAWAGVLGITPADIPTFVSGLTSVVLRSDTVVTNHGFVNGQATTIPAVLQAGTAVLVNHNGFPVTKCFCGNPLTSPTSYQRITFVGTSWSYFSATSITIIQPTVNVINQFTLVEPVTGASFDRPAGTDGTADTPATPATANPPGPTSAVPAQPPSLGAQGGATTTVPPSTTTPATTPATTTATATASQSLNAAAPGGTAAPTGSGPGASALAAQPNNASWVVGGCHVDWTGTPTIRGTVLVRNNDSPTATPPATSHTYRVTVTLATSSQAVATVGPVAPGQIGTAEVSTPASPAVRGTATPPCTIALITYDNGKTPQKGPDLPPPPDVPTLPSPTPSRTPSPTPSTESPTPPPTTTTTTTEPPTTTTTTTEPPTIPVPTGT